MLRPMTVLCTNSAGVIWKWRASTEAPTGRKHSERPGFPGALLDHWAGGCSVVRGLELDDELRDPVFDLGEGHGVDDLVADAVVILPTDVRLPPEVLELDRAQRLGDLLRVEALGLLHRGHERECRIGEVDAGRIPLAVLLGVPRLPALDLLRQRGLHVAVDPRALHVLLPRNARHHRGVHLPEVDEPALEAEHAGLLDDQADTARGRGKHADD